MVTCLSSELRVVDVNRIVTNGAFPRRSLRGTVGERRCRHAAGVTSRVSQIEHRVAAARAAIENLRPDELAGELADSGGRLVLVDVRSADEHRSGAIAGSINVPRGTIELELGRIADARSRVVVYCDTGRRSALAAATLYEIGYEDVAHLDGGLATWCHAGHPLTHFSSSG
jgi:rhodanese-related sulfurtransferase